MKKMNLLPTQVIDDDDYAPTQRIVYPSQREKIEQIGILKIDSDSYPIYKGVNKIGRHPECSVVVNHNTVSKEHAEIEADNGEGSTFICDMGSSNKTRVNNMVLRTGRSYQLKDGDSITFGQVTAIYKIVNLLNNIVIPETPVSQKAKKSQLIIPSTPDSSPNASIDADLSKLADTRREDDDLRLLPPPQQHPKKIHLTSNTLTVEEDSFTYNNIVDTDNSNVISSPVMVASSVSKEKKNLSIFEMDTQEYSTVDHNIRITDIHEEETQKFISNENVDKEQTSTSMTDESSEMKTNKVIAKIDDENLTSPRVETVNSETSVREYFNESLSPSSTNLYIDVDETDEDRNSDLDACVNLLGSQNLLDECVVDVANDTKTVEAQKLQTRDQIVEHNSTTRKLSSTFSQSIFDTPTQRISETKSVPQRLNSVCLESSALNDDSETDEEGIFEDQATKKNETVDTNDTVMLKKDGIVEQKFLEIDSDPNLCSNGVLFDAPTQQINEERDTREIRYENPLNAGEKKNSTKSTNHNDNNDDDSDDIDISTAPTQVVYDHIMISGHSRNDFVDAIDLETVAKTKESDSTDANRASGIVSTQVLNRDINSVSVIEAIELAPTQLLENQESTEKSKEKTVLNQIVDMKDIDYELASTQLIDVNKDRNIQQPKQVGVIKRITDQETTSAVESSRMDRSITLNEVLEHENTSCKLNLTFNENIFDAPTQRISKTNSNVQCSNSPNVVVMNDSVERKLNNMFDDIYENEDINETTSMSTQNIQKILESSQIDRDESTSNTIIKSVFDDQNSFRVVEEPSKLARTKKNSSRQNVSSLIPTEMFNVSVGSDKTSVTNDDYHSSEKYLTNLDNQSLDLGREILGFVDGKAVDSVPAYKESSKREKNPGHSSKIAKSKKSDTNLGSKMLKSLDDDNAPSKGINLERAKEARVSSRQNIPSLNLTQTSKTNSIDDDSPSVDEYFSNYSSRRKRNVLMDSDSQSSASQSGTLDLTNVKSRDNDKPVSNYETFFERKVDFGNKNKIAKSKNIDIGSSSEMVQPVNDDEALSKESDFDPLKLDTEEFMNGLPAVNIAGMVSNPASSLVPSVSSIDDIGKSTKRFIGRATKRCTKKLVRSKEKLSPKRQEDEERKPYCVINAQTPSSSRFSMTSDVTVAKYGGATKAKEFNDLDDDLEYMNLKMTAERLLPLKSNYSTRKLVPVVDATVELDKVDCKVHFEKETKSSTARNLCSVKANNDNSAKDQFTSAVNISAKPEIGSKMVRRSNKVDDVNSSALQITKVPSSDTNTEKSVGRTSRTKGRKIVFQEKSSLNLESEYNSVGAKEQKGANVRVRKGKRDTSILTSIKIEKDIIEDTIDSQGKNSKRTLRGSKIISSPSKSKETSSEEEEDTAESTTKATAKINKLKRPLKKRPRRSLKDSENDSFTVHDKNTNKGIVRNDIAVPDAINSNSEPGLESQEVEQILFNVANGKSRDKDARRIGEKCRKTNTRSSKKYSSRDVDAESIELNNDVPVEMPAKRSKRIGMAMVPVADIKLVVEQPKENKISERLRSDSRCESKEVHVIKNSPTNDGNDRKFSQGLLVTETKNSEFLRSKRVTARGKKKPAEKEPNKNDSSTNSSTDSVMRLTPIMSTPTRTRRSLSSSMSSLSSPSRTKPKILFTGVKEEEFKDVLLRLGGTVTEKPANCTVLVTDKVRRTFKFLCAVALAMPVVSVDWLTESARKGYFLNMEAYILHDPTEEAKFGFKLQKSLEKAREKKMLAGYTILLTPNVPPPSIVEIKSMIHACGGKTILRPPTNWHENTLIISREEDAANARKFISKAPKTVPLLTTEFILTGILRQELDFVTHKLTIK